MSIKSKIKKTFSRLPAGRRGFTLIEILIVFSIMTAMILTFIINFRPSAQNKTARTQTASVIISDIRAAQSMALSGTRYRGNLVCGYGLHYVDSITYSIYAKAVPVSGACASVVTHNYDPGLDFIVDTKKLLSTTLELRMPFGDLFFEPPDPKIYINNNSTALFVPDQIIIQPKGQSDCATKPCGYINFYASGRLDLLDQ